jgi:hypothetical protein
VKIATTRTRRLTLSIAGILALTAGLIFGSGLAVPSGSWVTTDSMSEARANAAAVLLADGRVLIIGGDNGSGVSASVEAYGLDDAFGALAPMHAARARHTATLLPDGRVLVVGGSTLGEGVTNSVEVYSPADDSWDFAASLSDARSGHSATLLPDGRVLIAGGEGPGGAALSSLEAYNFLDDSFSSAGSLSNARSGHAAALSGRLIPGANSLVDPLVLFIGGSNGSAPLASVEAYNPANGQVSSAGNLPEPRQGASASTLMGGWVYVAGGNDGSADLASGLIIKSDLSINPSAASLSVPRSGHVAVVLPDNNCVLLAGGSGSSGVDIYTPWVDVIHATGSMSAARNGAAVAPLAYPGRLLVAGGSGSGSAELYGFATVRTDKEDYQPGEVVTVTGEGWAPGESVELVFNEAPAQHEPEIFYATADASGNIFNDEKPLELHDLGVRYYLVATGADSGESARNTFSDAPSADIDQCRTGTADDPHGCDTTPPKSSNTGWVNGNAGSQTAHYAEGLSIGYRTRMEQVPTGSGNIVLFLGYDTKHSAHVALDFLTHYQCLEPHAAFIHTAETITPTDGTSFSGPAPSTGAIPAPDFAGNGAPGGTTPTDALDDCALPRVFSMWGGAIVDVAYFVESSYADGVSNDETQIMVEFDPSGGSGDVLLAWGGHIASRKEWGFFVDPTDPRSAGGISGSPYHMRLKDWRFGTIAGGTCEDGDVCTDPGIGDKVTNLGNQDRSLSAAAIVTAGIKRGRKFLDNNNNGFFDTGDAYVAGWVMNFYSDDGGTGGQLDATDTFISNFTTSDGTAVGPSGDTLPLGTYEFEALPGDYIVCEVLQNGFSQSAPANTVCSHDSALGPGGWAITLDDGEFEDDNDFGNVPDGSITIIKDASPADDTSFSYSVTGDGLSGFSLQDPSDNQEDFNNLGPGLRTVTESVPSGWTLTNIVCSGDTSSTITIGDSGDDPGSFDSDFDSGDDRVKIDLAAGEDIVCTFTNQMPALRISIDPDDANEVGDAHTFTVTVESDEDGDGSFAAVSGENPTVSFSPTPDSKTDNCASSGTDGSGQCTVEINNNDAETITADASITLTVNGVEITVDTAGDSGPGGSGPGGRWVGWRLAAGAGSGAKRELQPVGSGQCGYLGLRRGHGCQRAVRRHHQQRQRGLIRHRRQRDAKRLDQ